MNTELRKRLEEAAKKDISSMADNCYIRISGLTEDCYKDGFLAGAELGYKEAIKVAKEWLDYKVGGYLGLIREEGIVGSTFKTAQMLTDFEADMNKLLEKKK